MKSNLSHALSAAALLAASVAFSNEAQAQAGICAFERGEISGVLQLVDSGTQYRRDFQIRRVGQKVLASVQTDQGRADYGFELTLGKTVSIVASAQKAAEIRDRLTGNRTSSNPKVLQGSVGSARCRGANVEVSWTVIKTFSRFGDRVQNRQDETIKVRLDGTSCSVTGYGFRQNDGGLGRSSASLRSGRCTVR